MIQIFLAIPDEDTQVLIPVLKKRFPDSNIESIPSSKNISEIYQIPFNLLIVSKDRINIDEIPTTIEPDVLVIGEHNIEKSISSKIRLYKDTSSLISEMTYWDIKKISDKKINVQRKMKIEESPLNKTQTQSTAEDTVFEFSEINFCKPVSLKDYPVFQTLNEGYSAVQKIIDLHYRYQKQKNNKVIGFWSPLDNHQTVLHILINFAIFLGNKNINVAVLEALTSRPKLKTKLVQYKSMPKNWVSVMHPVFFDEPYDLRDARWHYRNVDWHPISKEIITGVTWKIKDVHEYFRTLSYCDIGLADFQFDEMSISTKYGLEHLDELWVFVDNRLSETWEWVTYIQDLQENYPFSVHLIFIKGCSPKRARLISKKLDIPYLTIIPELESEIQKNEEHPYPILDDDETRNKLEPSFTELAKYLAIQNKAKNRPRKYSIKDWLFKNTKPFLSKRVVVDKKI